METNMVVLANGARYYIEPFVGVSEELMNNVVRKALSFNFLADEKEFFDIMIAFDDAKNTAEIKVYCAEIDPALTKKQYQDVAHHTFSNFTIFGTMSIKNILLTGNGAEEALTYKKQLSITLGEKHFND